jgi:hypothetical protein
MPDDFGDLIEQAKSIDDERRRAQVINNLANELSRQERESRGRYFDAITDLAKSLRNEHHRTKAVAGLAQSFTALEFPQRERWDILIGLVKSINGSGNRSLIVIELARKLAQKDCTLRFDDLLEEIQQEIDQG